ncbi:MAG: polysaccharide deacetylase [Oceanospirillaceae bacterium]|nr:polysaccharide deacetylase [Oceanospirillaceae bacterium]
MIKNPIPWPNGARCAACITFDMDADSLIHLEHPKDGHRRVSAISMLRYGPEIGVPRILDTYRKLGIHQTFFIPAWCIEQYPQVVEAIVAGGHEVAHHGYLHENPQAGSREEQRHWLQRGIEVIERHTGRRPRGWRAPLYNFSDDSADLLIEEGFLYDASLMGDDIPYLISTAQGELVELPSHWGLDDWPQFVHSMDLGYMMPVRDTASGLAAFRQEFEAAYAYGGLWIPVWHPFATGRLGRWHGVEAMLEEMLGRGDVWFATLEEIAAHVRQCIDRGDYRPRVESLPQYPGPVSVS